MWFESSSTQGKHSIVFLDTDRTRKNSTGISGLYVGFGTVHKEKNINFVSFLNVDPLSSKGGLS